MPSKGIKKNCLNHLLSLSFPLKRGHFNLKKKKKQNTFKHCESLSKWSGFPHFAGEAWKRGPIGAGASTAPLGSPCSSLVRFLLTGTPCLLEAGSFYMLRVAFAPLPSHLMTYHWRALQPSKVLAPNPFSLGCKWVSLSLVCSCLPTLGGSDTWKLSRLTCETEHHSISGFHNETQSCPTSWAQK